MHDSNHTEIEPGDRVEFTTTGKILALDAAHPQSVQVQLDVGRGRPQIVSIPASQVTRLHPDTDTPLESGSEPAVRTAAHTPAPLQAVASPVPVSETGLVDSEGREVKFAPVAGDGVEVDAVDADSMKRDELEAEAGRLGIDVGDGKGENADGSYSVKQLREKVKAGLEKEGAGRVPVGRGATSFAGEPILPTDRPRTLKT